jgi:hypothetical protein
VFDKGFGLDSEIVYNWTESVDDKLGKTISDTIITINGVYKFHIEVEISGDNDTMAVRMFEYAFRDAVKYPRTESNKIILNLPEARIIYLEHNEKTPDMVEIVFNFQGQGVYEYRVKAEKLLNYTVEDLDKSGRVILMPLYLLKLRKEIRRSYRTKSKELAQELKSLIKSCIISIETNENQGNISANDANVILDLLGTLYEQLYGDYEIFKNEGVGNVLTDTLVLRTDLLALASEKKILEKTFEIAKEMLSDGEAVEKIEKFTKLPMAQILEIKQQLETAKA